MSLPWIECESRPLMPEDLPAPPGMLGDVSVWHELEAEDYHHLAVAFTGTGRPPELMMGWLYCWPMEDVRWRDPTFEELRSASGLCELKTCLFEVPPWPGGLELPDDAMGVLAAFRQCGAVQGTEAQVRFELATGIIVPPSVPKLH